EMRRGGAPGWGPPPGSASPDCVDTTGRVRPRPVGGSVSRGGDRAPSVPQSPPSLFKALPRQPPPSCRPAQARNLVPVPADRGAKAAVSRPRSLLDAVLDVSRGDQGAQTGIAQSRLAQPRQLEREVPDGPRQGRGTLELPEQASKRRAHTRFLN